jgi:hypothetical protein
VTWRPWRRKCGCDLGGEGERTSEMAQVFMGLGLAFTMVALFLGLLFGMEVLEKASEGGQLRTQEGTSDVPLPSVEQVRPEPSAAQELEPARAA